MLEITDNNIDEVVGSSELLLVDVWSEWCNPCKRSTPVFEEIASRYANDRIIFAKLDAQNNMGAGKKLQVMSLPTFIVFHKGNIVKKWTGANIDRLRSEIDAAVKLIN